MERFQKLQKLSFLGIHNVINKGKMANFEEKC